MTGDRLKQGEGLVLRTEPVQHCPGHHQVACLVVPQTQCTTHQLPLVWSEDADVRTFFDEDLDLIGRDRLLPASGYAEGEQKGRGRAGE